MEARGRLQLDQRFEHLGVDTLGRLVCAQVLSAQRLADPHDAAREAPIGKRISGHVGQLPHGDSRHAGLVDIDAHPAHVVVGERDNGRVELGRDALAGLAQPAEDDPVNRRADECLVVLRPRASSSLARARLTSASACARSSSRASASIRSRRSRAASTRARATPAARSAASPSARGDAPALIRLCWRVCSVKACSRTASASTTAATASRRSCRRAPLTTRRSEASRRRSSASAAVTRARKSRLSMAAKTSPACTRSPSSTSTRSRRPPTCALTRISSDTASTRPGPAAASLRGVGAGNHRRRFRPAEPASEVEHADDCGHRGDGDEES